MGFRVWKTKNVAPGVRLNLSKSGPSVSVGPKGMKKTVNAKGETRTTVGVPGTGVYYTDKSKFSKNKSDALSSGAEPTNNFNTGESQRPASPKKKKGCLIAVIVVAALIAMGAIISAIGGDDDETIQSDNSVAEVTQEDAESLVPSEAEAIESLKQSLDGALSEGEKITDVGISDKTLNIVVDQNDVDPTPLTIQLWTEASISSITDIILEDESLDKYWDKMVIDFSPEIGPVAFDKSMVIDGEYGRYIDPLEYTPLAGEQPLAEASVVEKPDTEENVDTLNEIVDETPKKENPDVDQSENYVASSESTKFHVPSCGSAKNINESNRIYFDTREEAIDAGYDPCKRCNP